MLKKWIAVFAACLMLFSAVPGLAADEPIAPTYVKGKITAVVAAEDGAFVYDDFDEWKDPVDALPYGAEIEIKTLGLALPLSGSYVQPDSLHNRLEMI